MARPAAPLSLRTSAKSFAMRLAARSSGSATIENGFKGSDWGGGLAAGVCGAGAGFSAIAAFCGAESGVFMAGSPRHAPCQSIASHCDRRDGCSAPCRPSCGIRLAGKKKAGSAPAAAQARSSCGPFRNVLSDAFHSFVRAPALTSPLVIGAGTCRRNATSSRQLFSCLTVANRARLRGPPCQPVRTAASRAASSSGASICRSVGPSR